MKILRGCPCILTTIFYGLSALITLAAPTATGAPRKALDLDAYGRWSWVIEPAISDNGEFVAFTVVSAGGEGRLVVKSTSGGREFAISRGHIHGVDGATRAPVGFTAPLISPDSRYVVFDVLSGTQAPYERSLAILRVPEGSVQKISRVAKFSTASRDHGVLGYLTDSVEGRATHVGSVEPPSGNAADGAHSVREAAETVATRGTLTVRNLRTGSEFRIGDVTDFQFDDDGRYVVYTVDTGSVHSGVYSLRLSDGRVSSILTGPGTYRDVRIDTQSEQLVFLANRLSVEGRQEPDFSLYYSPSPTQSATIAVKGSDIRPGFAISSRGSVRFVRSGNAVMFGITPRALGVARVRGAPELWQWQEAGPLRNAVSSDVPPCGEEYMGVYYVSLRRWVQLEDSATPLVLLGADGRHAIGVGLHSLRGTWDVPTFDITLIDPFTNLRQLFRHGIQPQMQRGDARDSTLNARRCAVAKTRLTLSPSGRYLLYFENQRWWSLDLEHQTLVDLTGSLLQVTTFDDIATQAQASQRLEAGTAGGIAGWTSSDRSVLLYSDRDIWELDPTGHRAPKDLTHATGKKNEIVFRFLERDADLALSYPKAGERRDVSLSGEETLYLNLDKPLLLLGVNQNNMDVGIWRMPARGDAPPRNLALFHERVIPIAQARGSRQILFTRESFREFPDLWVATDSFDHLKRLSNANPQQSEYRWGAAELIDFVSDFGVPLKGKLYKPDEFDSRRKYPMLVVLGNLEHMGLHEYTNPQTLPNGFLPVGWPTVVSRDYLLFVPDVLPTAPFPGQSAAAAVLAAVRAVIARGFVDSDRIALAGHSYGAFEAQYVLTQTSLFRCAIISAGFADLVALATAHPTEELEVVERGMGRLGGSLWDRPYIYFANSPLYAADRVTTPVLMNHNENDTVIPFTQGLGWFRSLRRNNKEVYMLSYANEGHTLSQRSNRQDWDFRVYEFLDYYLKDGPRPRWMDASSPSSEPIVTPTEGIGLQH